MKLEDASQAVLELLNQDRDVEEAIDSRAAVFGRPA
jgi:hypothetical protein